MKIRGLFGGLAALLLLIGGGCAAEQVQPEEEISIQRLDMKVGVIAPLSGDFAAIGQSTVNAAELAVAELDEVTLVVESEGNCDNTAAVNAATKLITIDGVDAIVGPVCAGGFQAVVAVAQQHNVPLLGPVVDDATVSNNGELQEYTDIAIGLFSGFDQYWRRLAQYAYEQSPTLAILQSIDAGVETNIGYFLEEYERLGGEVVLREKVVVGTDDFRTAILKLDEQETLVWPHLFSDDRIAFYQQKDEMNALQETLILGDIYLELETQKYIDALGENYLNGTISASFKDSTSAEFKQQYVGKYGSDPLVGADNAFDAVMHFSTAFSECEGNGVCAVEYFRSNEYAGASGVLAFDQGGRLGEPVIKVYKSGNFEVLE